MSGIKPIGTELLYSHHGAGTTSTPTVSPGSNIIGAYPPILVAMPQLFDRDGGGWSSSLKLKLGGQMTTTATVPTWAFILYASVATTSAPAFATSGITLGTTGALTAPSAGTNIWFDIELEIGLRILSVGAASTVGCTGFWRSSTLNAAGLASIPAAGSYTPPATFDLSQTYVLWPALSLGAATAGNTITMQYAKLYGEN